RDIEQPDRGEQVAETRHHRPRRRPPAVARNRRREQKSVGVEEVRRLDVAVADAGADVWREAVPGAEIDVAVEQRRIRGQVRGHDLTGNGSIAAVFWLCAVVDGNVGAEPVVLVTEAATDGTGVGELA